MTFSWSRILTWVVAGVVGAVYGLAGTIAHAFTWGGFPLGLVLAILGSAALLLAVRLLTGDRWSTLAAGIGMMIATFVFSGPGPGGSIVVPQSNLGIVWTVAVPLIVAVAVAWPDRFRTDPVDVRTGAEGVRRESAESAEREVHIEREP